MNEKLSISDLKSNNVQNEYKEVNASDILPLPEEKDPNEELVDEITTKLDGLVNRVGKEVTTKNEYLKQQKEEEIEEIDETGFEEVDEIKFDKGLNKNNDKYLEDVDEVVISTKQNVEPDHKIKIINKDDDQDFHIDEDDLDELDDLEDVETEEKEFKEMKSKLKQKLSPVAKVIDLKSFTIAKTPVSISNALKPANYKDHIIDWVLPSSNRIISMREFSGFEIDNLKQNSSGRNRFNEFKQIYQNLYNHIEDPNKPILLESWLKSFSFFDVEHLFFAVYKASFLNANYIPFQCPHCKEIFVSDDISIEDMVKYKDEKTKKKVEDILKIGQTLPKEYEVELIQVSDDFVMGFKEPSIYNVLFENLLLDDKFIEKYSKELTLIAYIDSIYLIDRKTNQLKPIEFKIYPDNEPKTVKNKIIKCSKIINKLTSDQLYQINSYREAIDLKYDGITYIIPSAKCPKCGKILEAAEMPAEQLLFTRHQLAAIANS